MVPESVMISTRRAATVALLSGLDDADAILSAAVHRDAPARSILYRQGERAAHMYLLRAGRVKLLRSTAGGREVMMHRLEPGECFGIASLLSGPASYVATAQAAEDAHVCVWQADAIFAAAATHPRLVQNALQIVLRYLEEFGNRHIALVSMTAEQRLARTLTHVAATSGEVLPAGVEVQITNQDLGSLADVGMYTVTRQLKRWERKGYLVKRRQRVLLRHPEALFGA